MQLTEINSLLEQLRLISNEEERVIEAASQFNNNKIPAKVIRLLYKELSVDGKMLLLNSIYHHNIAKENMQRLPPTILIEEPIDLSDEDEKYALGYLLGYVLVEEYDKSKIDNKFKKFEKVINRCKNNQQMYFPSNIDKDLIDHIQYIAIRNYVRYLVERTNEGEIQPLGLPKNLTFGVEIEFVKVQFDKIMRLVRQLKHYNIDYLEDFYISMDCSVRDGDDYGTEVSSPVFHDCEEDWEKLRNAMSFIKCLGGVANKTCGGHIHIGSNVLGYDTDAWRVCSTMYSEIEPLFYTISNRCGEKTRDGVNSYAVETAREIDNVDWNSIRIESEEDLNNLAKQF